jgi:DNA-binding IclR family transcriptional regulator
MSSEDSHEQQGVQALETGLGVLEAFLASVHPMMLKDISAAAGVHPAKAHRYLVSFVRQGYVEQDAEGRYRLGRNALRLGLSCLAQMDAVRLATRHLDDLCMQLEETVLAAVWGNFGPTVVQWRDSSRPVTVNVRPGSVLPMLSSATGRVFSAFLDEGIAAPLIAAELEVKRLASERRFPRSLKDVKQMKSQVRSSGVGTVNGDLIPGINSVSAPVFNHEGKIALAIAALGNERTFDADPDGPLAQAVRNTVAAISYELGFEALDMDG